MNEWVEKRDHRDIVIAMVAVIIVPYISNGLLIKCI